MGLSDDLSLWIVVYQPFTAVSQKQFLLILQHVCVQSEKLKSEVRASF